MSAVLTELEERLQEEQRLGNAAQHAYDNFIKGFVQEKQQLLFEAFEALPLTAELEMMEVKRMLTAVGTLNDEIKTIIATGKMASEMIKQEVKH